MKKCDFNFILLSYFIKLKTVYININIFNNFDYD